MAPCRGIADVFALVDFFLIFGAAIPFNRDRARKQAVGARPRSPVYFLNKLSNAARASLALRGAEFVPLPPAGADVPAGSASRAIVTRGENSSQSWPDPL